MQVPKVVGRRILLVEDDQAARDSLKLLLQIDRHMVREARDTVEALELFTHEGFDLVITDYYMPGNSGSDLALAIKRLAPNQPILLLSAFVEKLGGVCPGTDAILGKPFSIEDLRGAMARLLLHAGAEPGLTESCRGLEAQSPLAGNRA